MPNLVKECAHYVVFTAEGSNCKERARELHMVDLGGSQIQTDKGMWFRAEEGKKKCCPCMKPAESHLFFLLWADAISAHSKLAYGNKAS